MITKAFLPPQIFAQQGGFDIPANIAGDVALKLTEKVTVPFDIEGDLLQSG